MALASIIFAGVLAIQLPQVQTFLAQKAVSSLSDKLDGEIQLEKIHIKPFSTLVLKNVAIIDRNPVKDPADSLAPQIDTFFKAQYIIARFSLEGLISQNGAHIDKAYISNAQMNLVLEDNPEGTCRRDSSTQNLSRIFRIKKKDTPKEPSEKEIFHIRKVEIENMGFLMKNYGVDKTPYKGGIDWNDLEVNNINIEARELRFKGGIMYGTADAVSFNEKTGYTAERISGDTKVGDGKTIIQDLKLKDPWSDIELNSFIMSYDNSSDFSDFVNKVKLDGDIRKGDLSFRTLSYFVPGLEGNSIKAKVSGKVSGPVSDLHFNSVRFAMDGGGFSGLINGKMTGLPEIETTVFDAKVTGLNMTTIGFSDFVSSWMKGNRLDLGKFAPGTIFLTDAAVKGTLNSLDADVKINSVLGGVNADAKITDILEDDAPIGIQGLLKTDNLDIGKIVGTDFIHETTLNTGLKVKLAKGGNQGNSVGIDSLSVNRLNVNGYDYSAIRAAGTLSNEAFNGTIVSNDPALNFMFQGAFALSAKTSNARYKFWALLGHADLNAMNIDKRGISKVSLHTSADFTRTRAGVIMGNIDVANIVLENDEGRHNIGNINLTSHSNNDTYKIRLNSSFADGTYTGSAPVTDFARDLSNVTLKKETPSLFKDPQYTWEGNSYNVDFRCHNSMDLLSFVMPGLYIADSTSVKAAIDHNGVLKASIRSPRLAFGEQYMKNISASLDNADDNLSGEIDCEEIQVGSIALKDNRFQIFAENDHIGLGYRYENSGDLTNQGEFIIHGDLKRKDDILNLGINILPSSINLNSTEWNIMPSDIDIAGKEVMVNSFELNSDEQRISLHGRTSQSESDTLTLNLDRFDISILNPLIGKNLGIKGAVTGNVDLMTSSSGSKLFIDLLADSTHIADKPLGTLIAGCRWNDEFERFDIRVRNDFNGKSNIDIDGKLIPRSRMLEANAEIDRLHVGYAQPFIKDVFSEMDGYLSGGLSLAGPLDRLEVSSNSMRLDEAMLRVAYTNVPYYADGTFHIDNSGVFFDDMKIKDSYTGTGNVTGSINWNNLKDISFNTRLRVNEMEAINVSEKQADVFYGNVFATGNVGITGPISSLLLNVEAVTVKPGQLHIPISNTATSSSSENLLKFLEPEKIVHIDPYEQMISKLKKKKEDKSTFNVRLSVNASSDVEAFIEIDKASGNVLSGRGNGKIDLDVSSETFSINGDYTLTGGNYKFVAMGLVSKDFKIQDGSSLTFNGDIMETSLNINALYKTKTSLSTLLADTTSVSNRRTVECGIKITDKIRNPRLDFSINIPDLDPMVKSRVESALSTEDKVQKQFLSILLSNSFLPDEQSGIFNNSTMLYSNVSEMLANQISNIFQKLDIPLDLGLNYQPTEKGNDTFDVAVSTQLFNNRVSVNGSVGNKQYTSGSQNDVVGDLDIEIKLDRSGAFRLNLFSHSADSYTNYLDNSQRNGVGLTYQTEFNSLGQFFKNLFSSKKKRQEAKQAEEKAMLEGERVELKITDEDEQQ